ncbi:MAG: hypothetical protein ACREN5_01730, partial [Gemmatimonadales bacterium]
VVGGAIALERGSATETYRGFGGLFGWLSGDDNELTASVARFPDISADSLPRSLTAFALGSTYYPVGPQGLAPYLVSELGLVRYTRTTIPLLGSPVTETSNELLLGAGLGFRFTRAAATVAVEGRFTQIFGIESGLEARAHVGAAFGRPRASQLLPGTVGVTSAFLLHLGGAGRYVSRTPAVGARFWRYTVKRQAVSVDVLYAPVRQEDSTGAALLSTEAVVFAPGYQMGFYPDWGRPYLELGGLFAGFWEGEDKGLRSGVHAGVGVDFYPDRVNLNVNVRGTWFQRANGENVFCLLIGAGVSRRLAVPEERGR